MLILRLAYRNVIGAGLRTWLNVAVLSLIYVLIVWHQGLFLGMQRQSSRAVMDDEIGGGQYWHPGYDPYDPLSLEDGHGTLPPPLTEQAAAGSAAPILFRQAAIYPGGRMQSVVLRGIDPHQQVLRLATASLAEGDDEVLPVLVGKRMAKRNGWRVGDEITVRWRDANGTFDATDGHIVGVFDSIVPTVDMGTLWVPLERLRAMCRMPGEATLVVVGQDVRGRGEVGGWPFQNHGVLLKDIKDMVRTKRVGGAVMYAILLFLALLAVFDTVVLAVFKRRKEIGTLVALGMTRRQVVALFTVEGSMLGLLAAAVGAAYGMPLMLLTAHHGLRMPVSTDGYGFAMAPTLYPHYSALLVVGTFGLVMATVTLVSYLPSSRISRMNATEAIKGSLGRA